MTLLVLGARAGVGAEFQAVVGGGATGALTLRVKETPSACVAGTGARRLYLAGRGNAA